MTDYGAIVGQTIMFIEEQRRVVDEEFRAAIMPDNAEDFDHRRHLVSYYQGAADAFEAAQSYIATAVASGA